MADKERAALLAQTRPNMKIYMLDRRKEMVDAWASTMPWAENNITLMQLPLDAFLHLYDVDCVVSPANGFGLMDGGYDQAITDWYGPELQRKVQEHIISSWWGEQPVGTSLLVETDATPRYLIHTPTMRYPKPIIDPETVYHCTRSTLVCALKTDIKSIVLPAFGAGVGSLHPTICAEMMRKAIVQVFSPPNRISWEYVASIP